MICFSFLNFVSFVFDFQWQVVNFDFIENKNKIYLCFWEKLESEIKNNIIFYAIFKLNILLFEVF